MRQCPHAGWRLPRTIIVALTKTHLLQGRADRTQTCGEKHEAIGGSTGQGYRLVETRVLLLVIQGVACKPVPRVVENAGKQNARL